MKNLWKKLKKNSYLNLSGEITNEAFYNEAIANRTIARFVKENREVIENWLQSGEHRLQLDFEMSEPVGRVLTRGKGGSPNSKSIETKRVVIVAVRDKTPQGWHIETSFPIKSNGGFKF